MCCRCNSAVPLHLLLSHLQNCNSRFFVGPDDSKHLSLDSIGLNRGTYVIIGKMIAICLVHGGVGPYVFSERLLCQLTGEPAPPVDVMEIDDEDLKSQILEASYK
ncbi:unnamed protein product [Merluccius merluccius]